jgi:hypothetical protein
MLRPRLEAMELLYGCHEGAWEIPDHGAPVVVAGRNGSGKTTFLDGMVACLFGSERHLSPGSGAGDAWGRLRLARGGDRFLVRRDFRTGRTLVQYGEDGPVHFEGNGDPRAGSHEARRYRQVLSELLGVRDPDAYARTLYVRQGALQNTTLGAHLLQLAAGGDERVETARRGLAEAHRAITARPIHRGGRPAINPRELEKLDEEISGLRHRLEAARAAGARRGPLALDRERMAERLTRLAEEVDHLEQAHAALARGSAIEISARQLKELVGQLDQGASAIAEAAAELSAAEEGDTAALEGGRYPPDFSERLAAADLRWRDMERLEGVPVPTVPAISAVLLVAAGALWLAGQPPWLVGAVAVAGALAAGAAVATWLDARRARDDLRIELTRLLEGVPGADRLGPETREKAHERFLAQRRAGERLTRARARLARQLRHGRRSLASARTVGLDTSRPSIPEATPPPDGTPAVRRVAHRLRASAGRARDRLDRERRELDRVGDASLSLPDGVVPTEEGVAAALKERRLERRRLEESLREATQELLERGSPAESLDALEAALASLEPRREALARKAEVLEAAHALLADAYATFRDRDQERLVERISYHVERITDGATGPLVVEGSLEEARVRSRGRLLPPQSPPLSFGEAHALLLAVRFGAADFLGGMGVYPPLILDDPFAHLDPERARSLWEVLCRVAEERQVILTTQDVLLLSALEVEPDILLDLDDGASPARPRAMADAGATRPE